MEGGVGWFVFMKTCCEKRTFTLSKIDFVTQLVEYHTFNVRVVGSNPIGVTNIVNMVTLAEWFRHKFVALVYVGSNPTRHPL